MKSSLLALAASLVLVAGCGGNAPPPMPPPQVTVATPLVRKITDWDEYTGRLAAVEAVEIRARVSGYLQSVHFHDGALVKRGDLLFVIDPRPYQAALDEARAIHNRASVQQRSAARDLERGLGLVASRVISDRDLDLLNSQKRAADANLRAAEAAEQSAALNLEFTRILAPIDGRIGRKLVTVGNLVTGEGNDATLLTTLVSVDPIHVYFTADERAFLRYTRLAEQGIRPSSRTVANPVRLQLADEQGFPHEGVMDFVDNRVDEATGTMQGRAIFANPAGDLTPGLFGRLQLLGEGPYEALILPDQAIGTDQAQRLVYVVGADNVVKPQPVTLGRSLGALRVIRSGLKPTDRVVINGIQKLRPGSLVTPVEGQIPEPADGTAAAVSK
ncbi:MAG: efflux RND transporter periplasmic adaptor subunit [Chromatiales bacterium]|nr:efflux RND transporter periplasmic adaptor subunit [Chromatiales bacterium]